MGTTTFDSFRPQMGWAPSSHLEYLYTCWSPSVRWLQAPRTPPAPTQRRHLAGPSLWSPRLGCIQGLILNPLKPLACLNSSAHSGFRVGVTLPAGVGGRWSPASLPTRNLRFELRVGSPHPTPSRPTVPLPCRACPALVWVCIRWTSPVPGDLSFPIYKLSKWTQ